MSCEGVVDDDHQLDAHAVGVVEPDAVEGAEVFDGAVGGAPGDEAVADRVERSRARRR